MSIYAIRRIGETMKNKSIAALKEYMQTNHLSEQAIEQLQTDERKGVQRLLKSYKQKQELSRVQKQLFKEMYQIEQTRYEQGYTYIAGVDEAGRGPLAGPVVAAAVILPKRFKLLGLTDSKKLTEEQRNNFFQAIKSEAISYGLASVSNTIIDKINIYEATKKAMTRAVMQLDPRPDYALIDAVKLDAVPYPAEAIIKGDEKSITIAASSVLAKVTRDQIMKDIAEEHPQYGFENHKGYGTKEHLSMLKKHGITPYHRVSFTPVSNLMN